MWPHMITQSAVGDPGMKAQRPEKFRLPICAQTESKFTVPVLGVGPAPANLLLLSLRSQGVKWGFPDLRPSRDPVGT